MNLGNIKKIVSIVIRILDMKFCDFVYLLPEKDIIDMYLGTHMFYIFIYS